MPKVNKRKLHQQQQQQGSKVPTLTRTSTPRLVSLTKLGSASSEMTAAPCSPERLPSTTEEQSSPSIEPCSPWGQFIDFGNTETSAACSPPRMAPSTDMLSLASESSRFEPYKPKRVPLRRSTGAMSSFVLTVPTEDLKRLQMS